MKSQLLRIEDVTQATGLSRSSIWRLEKVGRFPKHVRITDSAIGWSSREVEAWIEEKVKTKNKSNGEEIK